MAAYVSEALTFGDRVLHLRLHHASMLKTFSLARMSPYTTSHNSRRYHRPHPPFTRIAIMYLWGQYSNSLSTLPNDCLTRPCLKLRRKIFSLIYRIENAKFVLRKYISSIGSRQERRKPATKLKKHFMISFIRTKIRELYSICKKVPSIGRQRESLKFATFFKNS